MDHQTSIPFLNPILFVQNILPSLLFYLLNSYLLVQAQLEIQFLFMWFPVSSSIASSGEFTAPHLYSHSILKTANTFNTEASSFQNWTEYITYSKCSMRSFTSHVFIEHFLYTGHCFKCWQYNGGKNRHNSHLHRAYSLDWIITNNNNKETNVYLASLHSLCLV